MYVVMYTECIIIILKATLSLRNERMKLKITIFVYILHAEYSDS